MSIKLIVGYILSVIILIGIIVFIGSKGTTTTAGKDDPSRPVATIIGEADFDFGAMKNSDIRTNIFEVKNTGKSDLELTNVSTSCDCTYVFVTASGVKSPRFTMHGTNAWKGKVSPGQTAQIDVIYEPAIMPVQGTVERVVSVVTNDPNNPELKFSISADVVE